MTWTKLGDDFPERCARAGLSDSAVRTHVDGLCWTMRRETGGLLDQLDLRRALESKNAPAAIRELVAAGWWEDRAEGAVQIIADMGDQPEPDVIQARRALAAERQRKKRRKDAKLDWEAADKKPPSRRDNPRDDTRYPGRVGTGRGETPTNGKSNLRSKISTDVGKKLPEQREAVDDDPWAEIPVAVPGAGLPDALKRESTDRCVWCEEPIDPAAGSIHPKCEVEELEQSRTS